MPIEISSETILSLSQAARSLPGRPHVSTLHRWRLRGVKGIRLETVMIGGRRFTSIEALARFSAAITTAANGESPRTLSPKRRQRQVELAEKELTRNGI